MALQGRRARRGTSAHMNLQADHPRQPLHPRLRLRRRLLLQLPPRQLQPLIQLSVSGFSVGWEQVLDFSWTGATSTEVDIYVNGLLVSTVPNTGSYTYFTRGGSVQ